MNAPNAESTPPDGLGCHVFDSLQPGQSPSLAVVLCHGYGAPGTDLYPLGPELCRMEPRLAESVRFYFPEAPLSLDELGMYGGRAWWALNIERMAAAVERGELASLRNSVPGGLPEVRELLTSFVAEVCTRDGIETSQVVLGGFSQGSMLATDVALHLSQPPAGLCILSGTLLCEDEWRELAVQRGKLPVFQSHGYSDPLLAFAAAEALRDLLDEGEADVEFVPFDGMHTIPAETMRRMAAFLVERLPAAP